ncbi:unnamed protein product [Effrenium voratum]|nr:unnamed protein product [Effrenium voratum]
MADETESNAAGSTTQIAMVPPCRLIVRATAGARVIGKQGASVKAIRAMAGAHSVRVLQDELPEALKRRQECIVMISCGEEGTLRQAVSMVLDRVFDRSGLPDTADRDRERPHVLDMIVPERAGGGIVGQGGERIRAIIEELGCEVQVSREPLAGIAGHKRVKLLARDRKPIEAALWRLQSTLKELVGSEVLRPEHFELREALPSEEEAAMRQAKAEAAAAGRGEVPLRILLAQGEAATVVGKLGANVARLRDLALVSIDDAMAPLDCTERICSAQMASLAQRLRVLRLVLGDLATRNAAIAREEAGYEEPSAERSERSERSERQGEGLRPVKARLLFPAERWPELEPVLKAEQSSFPEVQLEAQAAADGFHLCVVSMEGPEEAVALSGWRLHRCLEPWEVAEPPPRVQLEEEEDDRPKGKAKGKGKGAPAVSELTAVSSPHFGRLEEAREARPRFEPNLEPRAPAAPAPAPAATPVTSAEPAREAPPAAVPLMVALPDQQTARWMASEASGIARKTGVKLSSADSFPILEIRGSPDNAAAACYFVQLQLWMSTLRANLVFASWQRLEGEKMIQDDSIKVTSTSSIAKPAKLHVSSPNGQQNCGGEYVLMAGESANSNPLWQQMGGKYWLYSGTNGLWILGGNGAKKKGFECSLGVIYSATPHGGQMPHQVPGIWNRLQGQEFVEDDKIRVSEGPA